MTSVCNLQINFCHVFTQLLVIFGLTSTKAYRNWVSCERKSSFSFSLNFFKLCRCFCQILKMCMNFRYIPQIIFWHFFRSLNLIIFSSTSTKTYRNWVSCERKSFFSFSLNFLKLCRCFCQVLKMCMTFGCIPQITFWHFFRSLNLVIFGST